MKTMNRRAFLMPTTKTKIDQAPPPAGLEPYTGSWTVSQAAHLLRRATFGSNFTQIQTAFKNGLSKTVDNLFIAPPINNQPLNFDFDADPRVPIGQTWVNIAPNVNQLDNNYRYRSIYGWNFNRIISGEQNIREKLTLFWHNHFVISDMNDARYYYKYIATLRDNAMGNFKTLTQLITLDPSMLRYLNGNQNTKAAPNENYARELLELFTLGKGPLVGPGDYTNYTEADILAIAKILTGWRDRGNRSSTIDLIDSYFTSSLHDTSTKKLSPRFNNVTIANGNELEYKNLLDVIFQHKAAGEFIARKLYQWFVSQKVDANVESEIIVPLADIIRKDNYEISNALKTLFKSNHFFSKQGCMIKSPLDFIAASIAQNTTQLSSLSTLDNYNTNNALHSFSTLLDQRYFDAPNVAGWKAYYQQPIFDESWINSVTLPNRINYIKSMANNVQNFRSIKLGIMSPETIASFSNPKDINAVIDDFCLVYFPKSISTALKSEFKKIAMGNSVDSVWKLEYEAYIAAPTNATNKAKIETRLKAMLIYMMQSSEYQIQ
jgi:uncharacterized protein (DUF1800 family)